ncbi:MAG TPA: ABC-type transport auxiliary lipoprotein family protein [Bryobacteraceae bacterium]|nr:ABC-type transport auxiliary lipoprotein family protein [Bryobacteraceae bacterium]
MGKSTVAAMVVGLAAMGGCAKVRYPDYYTLNPPKPISPPRTSVPIAATVVVREFRAPEYLRQGPIVYRPEPNQIVFYDYHHWAENPRRIVTAAIVSELQGLFETTELYDGHSDADFLVTGSLDHLEEVDNGGSISVEVGISAKLQNLKSGDIVWSGTSSKTSRVDQRSISGIVAEMSRDMGEAAGQLVSSMRTRVSQRSLSNP